MSRHRKRLAPVHVVDAIELRERHGAMLHKMKSLQLAIGERRNQMQTEQRVSGTRRLKSARVAPPKYVTALQNMIRRDLDTLGEEFQVGVKQEAYSYREEKQLTLLVKDLQTYFDFIIQSLYVPADDPNVPLKPMEEDSGMDAQTDSADEDDEPKAEPEVDDAPVSRNSSLFPDIKPAPSSDGKEFGLVRGYTTLNKYPLRSKLADTSRNNQSYTYVKRASNIGYPYNGAFPEVMPLPGLPGTVNNRQTSFPVIGQEKKVPSRTSSLVSRCDSMVLRITKEKTWFY